MNSAGVPGNGRETQDFWQVEVNGIVYDTNTAEMAQWIAEGAVMPYDKVRRGNLRWLEADKIPALMPFFNAKERGMQPQVNVTATYAQPEQSVNVPPPPQHYLPEQQIVNPPANVHHVNPTQQHYPNLDTGNQCQMHQGEEAKYVCKGCLGKFCKNCPKKYGSVSICSMCGGMCDEIQAAQKTQAKKRQFQSAVTEGFGFADFGRAFAYPFKFKSSLIFGAIFFTFFSIGQQASAIGGPFMLAAALICFMLSNMLTFGSLMNVVDNFAQGDTESDFLPSFENFSIWESVVRPFFLYIAVILVTLGPALLIIIVGSYMAISSMQPSNTQPGQVSSMLQQKDAITGTINEKNQQHLNDIDQAMNPGMTPGQQNAPNEEEGFRRLNGMINESRKQQLESAIGPSPETMEAQNKAMIEALIKSMGTLLIVLLVAALWAIFYCPAACIVAGYTQSFVSTLNVKTGFDTIKRMGADYFKLVLIGILLAVVMIGTVGVIGMLLSPFDMPRFGNLAALVVASPIMFYSYIVFNVTVGYAVYKNAAKLDLYRP